MTTTHPAGEWLYIGDNAASLCAVERNHKCVVLPDRPGNKSLWTYARSPHTEAIEYAYWNSHGSAPLRAHFHDELQVTLILTGGRTFTVGTQTLQLAAGEYIAIPPGCPHRANTPEGTSSAGVNLYLRDTRTGQSPYSAKLDAAWINGDCLDLAAMIRFLRAQQSPSPVTRRADADGEEAARLVMLLESFERLADVACRHGLARETFTRNFTRLFGMSPHRYRMVSRLNHGRKRLRDGDDVARVVADLDFADQSHFTRLFRATFGTTPARYRKSGDRSHPF